MEVPMRSKPLFYRVTISVRPAGLAALVYSAIVLLADTGAAQGMSKSFYYDHAPYGCYFRVARCYGTGLYWSGYPDINPAIFWGARRIHRHTAAHRVHRAVR
jgi:hypothetical protein